MGPLLKKLKPEIDATIARLKSKADRFKADPIAGRKLSRTTSIVSSAYKRHGYILERAIIEQLKRCKNLEVWTEPTFHVSATADTIVSTLTNPGAIFANETGYEVGKRSLQVDIVVFNKKRKSLNTYEVKRGSGLHDSGKRRSILRDLHCLQTLLKSYGKKKKLRVSKAHAHIIFYYGECSIQKPFALVREELDKHFGCTVVKPVEEVNQYFKDRLMSIV